MPTCEVSFFVDLFVEASIFLPSHVLRSTCTAVGICVSNGRRHYGNLHDASPPADISKAMGNSMPVQLTWNSLIVITACFVSNTFHQPADPKRQNVPFPSNTRNSNSPTSCLTPSPQSIAVLDSGALYFTCGLFFSTSCWNKTT